MIGDLLIPDCYLDQRHARGDHLALARTLFRFSFRTGWYVDTVEMRSAGLSLSNRPGSGSLMLLAVISPACVVDTLIEDRRDLHDHQQISCTSVDGPLGESLRHFCGT